MTLYIDKRFTISKSIKQWSGQLIDNRLTIHKQTFHYQFDRYDSSCISWCNNVLENVGVKRIQTKFSKYTPKKEWHSVNLVEISSRFHTWGWLENIHLYSYCSYSMSFHLFPQMCEIICLQLFTASHTIKGLNL